MKHSSCWKVSANRSSTKAGWSTTLRTPNALIRMVRPAGSDGLSWLHFVRRLFPSVRCSVIDMRVETVLDRYHSSQVEEWYSRSGRVRSVLRHAVVFASSKREGIHAWAYLRLALGWIIIDMRDMVIRDECCPHYNSKNGMKSQGRPREGYGRIRES